MGTRRICPTVRERNALTQVEPLLEGLTTKFLLADRGYDGAGVMRAIASAGAKKHIVPLRSNKASRRKFEASLSKECKAIYKVGEKLPGFHKARVCHQIVSINGNIG